MKEFGTYMFFLFLIIVILAGVVFLIDQAA